MIFRCGCPANGRARLEDGYSLIKKLRRLKSKHAREIPAVALTAYATKEDQARTISSGFQMHVAKPIDPENLIRSIAQAMGRKVGPSIENHS